MGAPFAMIPLAALLDRRLTFRPLKVFGAICSFRESSDVYCVEAGRDEIASRCGFNPSIVSVATTELQRLGWLIKQGVGGRGMKTSYTITIPETVPISETVTESETVLKSGTVAKSKTVPESVSKTVPDSGTLLIKEEVNPDMGPSGKAEDGFEAFWKQYPRKVAKPDALRAWKRLKPAGRLLADLMAGLERQKVSIDWQKGGGQFVPYPATWLNSRRWEDEIQEAQSTHAEDSIFAGAL